MTNEVSVFDSGTLVVDPNISDHKCTYISIKTSVSYNKAYERKVWQYKNADFDKLNLLIKNTDWNTVILSAENVDQAVLNFSNTFLTHIRECIPEKVIIIRPKDKPWFDSALRKEIRIRNRLRKIALKSNKAEDIKKFKKSRNKINNMKKHAINNYYNNLEFTLLDSSKNNSKLYWKLLKNVFNVKSSSEIPPLQYSNDNGKPSLAYSSSEKVEVLNSYFSSISFIDDSNAKLPDFYSLCNKSISDICILEQEVIDIISILQTNKAVGPDNISHKMLKSTVLTIAKPLCLLFNRSLSDCIFPCSWKLANVLPLYKKDDSSCVSNYRPVSLLSCVSKIMERIIFKHVYNYFYENDLFYKYQAGFLPGHSTVYQLIEMYDHIVKALDEGKSCCMVFCDLSKAFDRVWHRGLLFKLQTYGITGNLFNWLSSYLVDRKQRVLYRESLSSSKPIYAGVPQGSVLGPLLFLIYVNDVASSMSTFCRLFADDNSLQHTAFNSYDIEYKLNQDLLNLETWSKNWLLSFNPSKTKAIFFSTRKTVDTPILKFQNCQLDLVSSHKHLGLTFSDDLTWTVYINSIIANAKKKLGLMKKLKFRLNRNTLSLLYTAFIRPQLEYASDVWGGCSSSDCERLEKIQLIAARIVSGLPIFASKESLYFETGWDPLSTRRKISRLKTMYKIDRHLLPDYISNIFPKKRTNISIYNTRNSENYSIPKCRLQLYKCSFIPTVVNEWNALSVETRQSDSIRIFKKQLAAIFAYNDCNTAAHKSRPEFYSFGDRYTNIIHTKLRHNCALNSDLFRFNIINSPLCSCGKVEDTYHYFFTCTKYSALRNDIFNEIFRIENLNIVNTHVLLWGDCSIGTTDNKHLFSLVHRYIKSSKRFNYDNG